MARVVDVYMTIAFKGYADGSGNSKRVTLTLVQNRFHKRDENVKAFTFRLHGVSDNDLEPDREGELTDPEGEFIGKYSIYRMILDCDFIPLIQYWPMELSELQVAIHLNSQNVKLREADDHDTIVRPNIVMWNEYLGDQIRVEMQDRSRNFDLFNLKSLPRVELLGEKMRDEDVGSAGSRKPHLAAGSQRKAPETQEEFEEEGRKVAEKYYYATVNCYFLGSQDWTRPVMSSFIPMIFCFTGSILNFWEFNVEVDEGGGRGDYFANQLAVALIAVFILPQMRIDGGKVGFRVTDFFPVLLMVGLILSLVKLRWLNVMGIVMLGLSLLVPLLNFAWWLKIKRMWLKAQEAVEKRPDFEELQKSARSVIDVDRLVDVRRSKVEGKVKRSPFFQRFQKEHVLTSWKVEDALYGWEWKGLWWSKKKARAVPTPHGWADMVKRKEKEREEKAEKRQRSRKNIQVAPAAGS